MNCIRKVENHWHRIRGFLLREETDIEGGRKRKRWKDQPVEWCATFIENRNSLIMVKK